MTTVIHSGGDVLLVGSVGLRNEEEVFRTASALLGPYLKRIPDGEILVLDDGRRINRFTRSQRAILEIHPAFEPDHDETRAGGRIVKGPETARQKQPPRFRLRPDANAGDVTFETTRHAQWALAAYGIFGRLKRDDMIRSDVRLQ